MGWETEMARAIRQEAKKPVRALPQTWYRAKVAQVTPTLIFTIADGEMKFDAETGNLIMTRTAAGRSWTVGSEAVAILSKPELLVLDAL